MCPKQLSEIADWLLFRAFRRAQVCRELVARSCDFFGTYIGRYARTLCIQFFCSTVFSSTSCDYYFDLFETSESTNEIKTLQASKRGNVCPNR